MSTPTEPAARRGLPRLKHRLSLFFAFRDSKRKRASQITSPLSPQSSTSNVQSKTPIRKQSRTKKRRSSPITKTQTSFQKLELPDLKELSWDTDSDSLSLPYLSFERSTSERKIDWDKELEHLHQGPRRMSQVIPDPSDDERDRPPLPEKTKSPRSRPTSTIFDKQSKVIPRSTPRSPEPRPRSEVLAQRRALGDVTNIRSSPGSPPVDQKRNSIRQSPAVNNGHTNIIDQAAPTTGLARRVSLTRVGSSGADSEIPLKAPAKKKWEVKTDTLLQPVASSSNPAANKVAQTIEQLNIKKRHSLPVGGLASTSVASRKSSVGDIRSVARAETLGPAFTARDTLAVSNASNRLSQAISIDSPASTASEWRPSVPGSLSDRRASLNSQTTATTAPRPDETSRGRAPTSTPPADASSGLNTRRNSSRANGDRLAWIRSLEEGSAGNKNPGRDMVFRKMEGGVAAKLARFEQKNNDAAVPSAAGAGAPKRLPRTGSIISNASAATDGGAGNIGVGLSRRATYDVPGAEKSVMTGFDEGFKQKMEMLAGSLANKADKKSSTEGLRINMNPGKDTTGTKPSSGAQEESTGPDARTLAAKRSLLGEIATRNNKPTALPLTPTKNASPSPTSATGRSSRATTPMADIPQEVIDLILLSGADPEVAINDIVGHEKELGRSLTWGRDEGVEREKGVVRQIERDAEKALRGERTPLPIQQPVARETSRTVAPVVVPVVSQPTPVAVKEVERPAAVSAPIIQSENPAAAKTVVSAPATANKEESFVAARLPFFA